MENERLEHHYVHHDVSLKRAKKDFESRYSVPVFEPNANFVDFQLIKTIGEGAFGKVFLTKRKKFNTMYAMKCLDKFHVVNNKQVDHIMFEIRLLDAIRFEFLVHLDFFFKDNVYIFIVMPFINGGEMFVHLRHLKKFDETLSKFYAAQVILAFEYLHFLGIVYRDLKPENIMVDREGYLKITDMGFAKKIDNQRTYTLCGTPDYLAPEIILSQGYTRSVDWWTIGVLIYEMSAGYPPFSARDTMQLYEKIVSGSYSCPTHFSRALRHLVWNILQVDRTKRYGILKNGVKDVKGHEWFKSIDFDQILQRNVRPLYRPKVKDAGDTSNFDSCDEKPLRSTSIDEFSDEFAEIKIPIKYNNRSKK